MLDICSGLIDVNSFHKEKMDIDIFSKLMSYLNIDHNKSKEDTFTKHHKGIYPICLQVVPIYHSTSSGNYCRLAYFYTLIMNYYDILSQYIYDIPDHKLYSNSCTGNVIINHISKEVLDTYEHIKTDKFSNIIFKQHEISLMELMNCISLTNSMKETLSKYMKIKTGAYIKPSIKGEGNIKNYCFPTLNEIFNDNLIITRLIFDFDIHIDGFTSTENLVGNISFLHRILFFRKFENILIRCLNIILGGDICIRNNSVRCAAFESECSIHLCEHVNELNTDEDYVMEEKDIYGSNEYLNDDPMDDFSDDVVFPEQVIQDQQIDSDDVVFPAQVIQDKEIETLWDDSDDDLSLQDLLTLDEALELIDGQSQYKDNEANNTYQEMIETSQELLYTEDIIQHIETFCTYLKCKSKHNDSFNNCINILEQLLSKCECKNKIGWRFIMELPARICLLNLDAQKEFIIILERLCMADPFLQDFFDMFGGFSAIIDKGIYSHGHAIRLPLMDKLLKLKSGTSIHSTRKLMPFIYNCRDIQNG